MEIVHLLVDEPLFALVMTTLGQCTVALALALLLVGIFRRSASVRASVLKTGMLCALVCPVVTVALNSYGLCWLKISLPAPPPNVPALAQGEYNEFSQQRTGNAAHASHAHSVPGSIPTHSEIKTDTAQTSAPTTAESGDVLSPPDSNGGSASDETALRPSEPLAMARASRPQPVSNETTRAKNAFGTVVWLVVAAWAAGLFVGCLGILRSGWNLRRILQAAKPDDDRRLQTVLPQVQTALGMGAPLSVVASRDVSSPVTAGLLRPLIVLPAGLCQRLSPCEMRVVLLHEGAHVVRRDHLNLLIQRLFTSILWFHPLAHLLVRRLARAREEVCDNYVLQVIDGPVFGEALLRLTKLVSPAWSISHSVGMFSTRWKLEQRIRGLLNERRSKMVKTRVSVLLLTVMSMSLFVIAIGNAEVGARPKADERVSDDTEGHTKNSAQKRVDKSVAATVNGEEITYDELVQYLLKKHGADDIEAVINRKLIEQACRKNGVKVTDADIDAEVEVLAKKFGHSVEEWYRVLQEQRDLTKDAYRQDVVWPTVALKQLAGQQDKATFFNALKANARVDLGETPDSYSFYDRKVRSDPTGENSQRRRAAAGKGRVAFVDLARILNNFGDFDRQMESLKNEVMAEEKRMVELRKEIQQLKQAAKAISDDNVEAKSVLEKVIRDKEAASLQSHKELRDRFQVEEATVYVDTYRRIYSEIREYARQNGIDLVVRGPNERGVTLDWSDPAKINPKNRTAVLQQLNRRIIYAGNTDDTTLDITDEILKRLKNRDLNRSNGGSY